MRIGTIVICIVLVGIVATVTLQFLADGKNNYGATYDTSTLRSLDKINETYDLAVQSGESAQGTGESLSQEGVTNSIEQTAGSVKLFFKTLTIVPSMISETGEYLGIPSYITWGFLTIVIVTVVLAILLFLRTFFSGAGGTG